MKKPLFIAVSGACIAALTAGTAVFAAAHKTIDLDVDGNITQITTFSGSVEGLLAQEGIELAPGDVVAPASGATLAEGSQVTVRYQREVSVDRNGEVETLKTTALDAEELLDTLGARGENVALVASRSNDRVSLDLRLNTDGPVALVVDGKNIVVPAGHGGIDAMLAANNIEVGDQDRVSIRNLAVGATGLAAGSAEAPADAAEAALSVARDAGAPEMVSLVIQRVVVSEDTATSDVDFETITKKDATRFKDLGTLEQTKGVKGERTKTFTVTSVDGVEESREQVSDEVTTKPVDRVLVVGTKARPVAPKPAPKKATSSKSSSNKSSSAAKAPAKTASGDVWAALARCESGGRANAVSRSGAYHGLYQFSVATWRSVGGSGLPSQASPAEQTKRAKMLQARSGWGQWPSCSRQIGVR